ncbi:MAG: hypothetical protein ACI87O_001120 [Planctomycetota bacterium]|jgi:hypothetical protein
MDHQQKQHGWFWAGKSQKIVLSVLALLGILACANRAWPEEAAGPQHGWWQGNGPVVSHESFSLDCMLCHTGKDWHTLRADFEFDHLAQTGVALQGAHSEAQCLRCHNDRGPTESFASQGCSGCHVDVHEGKQGKSCQDCHRQEDWILLGSIMDHARTRFPLVGAHAGTACRQCHQGIEVGNMFPLDVACESCHGGLEAQVADPDHTALGWVQACDECHQPTTWGGQGFIHTGLALTGGHAAPDCNQCHVGGAFGGAPRDCVDCHQSEYDATSDPDHIGAGFLTDCRVCHSVAAWVPATFTHSTFAITGAHRLAGCNNCHTGGVFEGLPSDCVDCHLSEYQSTTNPAHQAQGFSTACDGCHDTNMWEGAVFNHSFPINSGAHNGFDCTECHLSLGSNDISCTHCHEHRQSEADAEHDGVSGYVWLTSACYNCHPNGQDLLHRGPSIKRAPHLRRDQNLTGRLRDLLQPR